MLIVKLNGLIFTSVISTNFSGKEKLKKMVCKNKNQDRNEEAMREIETLIEELKVGEGVVTPAQASQLRNIFQKHHEGESGTKRYGKRLEKEYDLKKREQQVAYGLIEGNSYQEIGEELHISINTVRHYVKTLYKKIGINNKIQLFQKLEKAF